MPKKVISYRKRDFGTAKEQRWLQKKMVRKMLILFHLRDVLTIEGLTEDVYKIDM